MTDDFATELRAPGIAPLHPTPQNYGGDYGEMG